MFTADELILKFAAFVERVTPIESLLFEQDAFPSSSSEDTITICRGLKSDFENSAHFWTRAHLYTNPTIGEPNLLPYLYNALSQPIIEHEFLRKLNRTSDLKVPVIIKPRGEFIGGLKMWDDWNVFSAIAEFENEYLMFDWYTTA
jgi:hypothetical protein